MNLRELTTPIVVYWDLNPQSSVSPHIIQRICRDLVDNRIFILNLWDSSSDDISSESVLILEKLSNENINITLTINHSALRSLNMKDFMPAIKKILIKTESLNELVSITDEMQAKKADTLPIEISFVLSEMSFMNMPDVLRFCLKAGIKDIHFPIQRPKEGKKIFWPDAEKSYWLSEKIKDLQTNSLNMTIHDPFLYKIFHGGINQNELGCQGANTMIYISDNLDVTPCPVLPITLGNLNYATMKEILSSESRYKIRALLTALPKDCEMCKDALQCLGGCRGRAYVIKGSIDYKDPACNEAITTNFIGGCL